MPADSPIGGNAGGARYARHAALGLIGPAGQGKISKSSVLVLGCGSIGSAQAMLLARAGAGRLILADRDVVQLNNLPTQILYDESDVRERAPKAEAAARRLRAVNPEIKIEAVQANVDAANVEALVARADLVMDGADNFETRFLLNDAAVKAGKPWVYCGVLGTAGMVMAVRPGLGPCLRCLFEPPPADKRLPSCDAFGILNANAVWAASLQVAEAIKILAGAPYDGAKLYNLDIWRGTAAPTEAARNPACHCCGRRNFGFLAPEKK